MSFCKELKDAKWCKILNEECFRTQMLKPKECEFIEAWNLIKNYEKNKPLCQKVKKKMAPIVLEEWKRFAKERKSGSKRMTGGPLEETIREIVNDELSFLGASVYKTGKKISVWKSGTDKVSIIADYLAEKGNFKTIVSVKSWIGSEQIRETFAYAYFAKTWYGQKNVRVYQVGLHPFKENLKSLVEACKPYIDGIYSLSSKPFFDELVQKMKLDFSANETYKK